MCRSDDCLINLAVSVTCSKDSLVGACDECVYSEEFRVFYFTVIYKEG